MGAVPIAARQTARHTSPANSARQVRCCRRGEGLDVNATPRGCRQREQKPPRALQAECLDPCLRPPTSQLAHPLPPPPLSSAERTQRHTKMKRATMLFAALAVLALAGGECARDEQGSRKKRRFGRARAKQEGAQRAAFGRRKTQQKCVGFVGLKWASLGRFLHSSRRPTDPTR